VVARVTFPGGRDGAFIAAVRRDVSHHFGARDGADKANGPMMVKTAILLVFTLTAYGLLLNNRLDPLAMLGAAALLGVGIAGLGFCVAHDALHGAYSDGPGSTAP
jgi:linoleoyl-CoA desaturase